MIFSISISQKVRSLNNIDNEIMYADNKTMIRRIFEG